MSTFALAALLILAVDLSAQTVLGVENGTTDLEALGSSIAAGGDVNGDGFADIVLGAPAHNAGSGADQGRVLVISGPGGAALFAQVGAAVADRFGAAVSIGFDTNLDGQADIAVGAPGHDGGLGASQGQVTVYSGANGTVLLTLDGATLGDEFGAALVLLEDQNADGRADIAIGAPLFDGVAGTDSGRITVHSGLDGSILYTVEGTNAGDRFGAALAAPGDLDQDGTADLLVGIPGFDGTAGADCGRVAVLSGATQSELLVAEGSQAGVAFGSVVAAAGDVNNDARCDIAVGVPLYDGVAGTDCGRVVVLSGRDQSELLSIEGATASDLLGSAVSGGRDANADGFDDLLIGAPSFDGVAGADAGRITLISGVDGTVLLTLEGEAAGDGEGSAVSLIASLGNDTRADLITAAPLADLTGTDRGMVTTITFDTPSTSKSSAYDTENLPRNVTTCDADGDGDLDVIVVSAGFVSVLWNTDQTGGSPTAALNVVARTDVALTVGANGVSVTAGQLDADAACEIIVGRDDGTIDILDGTGMGAGTAFSLSGASPVLVDTAVSPGNIASVAILGSGASASIVCAGAGSLVLPGFLEEVTDPLGTPLLTGGLVMGGSFTDVIVGDINGDTIPDVIAANASTGGSGGVHVLLGPGLTTAVGSPFSAGTPPLSVALLDLDGLGTADDVAIASLALTSGGVRILPNFVDGVGFGATFDPGLVLARDVAGVHRDADGLEDLAVLDGAGNLLILSEWTGAAFATTDTLPTTDSAGVALSAAQLTAGPTPDDTQEVVVVHTALDLVTTWCGRRPFAVIPVPNTGCPAGAPTSFASVSGDPVLGGTSLTVDLVGAAPLSLCFLVAQENEPAGSMPTVDATSGCGFAMSASGDISQFFTFTNAQGQVSLPAGLPVDPSLVGSEFLLQWAILDGGPLLGSLSVSDAIVVRIGEP